MVGRVVFLAAAVVCSSVSARADVQPGDVITRANADKVKDLVSPGLMWCIERGLTMRIVESRPLAWPQAYREATEKYSGQVKLSPDGRVMSGYVAGMPFPNIDPNDPLVANKIMWNYDRKSLITDDVDLRNFDADTGTIYGGDKEMSIERHFLLDHFRIEEGSLLGAARDVVPGAVFERRDGGG